MDMSSPNTTVILSLSKDEHVITQHNRHPEPVEGWTRLLDNATNNSKSPFIRASFFSLRQPLICFSALMAEWVSAKNSLNTSRNGLLV